MEDLSAEKITEILGARLPEIRERYGVRRIQLYGSIARGRPGPTSDVDLLIEFSGVPTLFQIARLQEELEELLGREVDITTPGGLHPRVLSAARADAVEIGPGA